MRAESCQILRDHMPYFAGSVTSRSHIIVMQQSDDVNAIFITKSSIDDVLTNNKSFANEILCKRQ